MDSDEIQSLVKGKVKDAIQASNGELFKSICDMINKISAPSTSSAFPSALDAPKFKRKSNEEQYKQNYKVLSKLHEAEDSLDRGNLATVKQSIIEAQGMIRHRQKLVQLADMSELGWRTVAEYETNPIASDSEDEKRIHKAEVRASRKAKTEKSRKRPVRNAPYQRSRPRFEATPPTQMSSGATTASRSVFPVREAGPLEK